MTPLFRSLMIGSLALFAMPALASDEALPRLNQATAEQFASIEGVDEPMAVAIVDLREARGGQLGSVEALRILNVPPTTLDALRDNVVVDVPITKTAQGGKSYSTVAEVMAAFAGEPDVRKVQAMTMAYTKTNPELVQGWLAASRNAYLLPKLNLKYQKDLDYGEDYIYIDDGSGNTLATLDGVDSDNDDSYEVKLEWRLDKLVMSSERIRVINEAQDIVKLRDKVLDEVTRLYFDRRRLQVELLLSPPSDLRTQIKQELQLQELTANIDALTGGGFSAALP